MTPTPAPTATTAGVPLHIATWAYDEYGAQGGAAAAALVRTYVTYAEGVPQNMKAVTDCQGSNSCYSVTYFDPNFVWLDTVCPSSFATGLYNEAAESWFIHQKGHTDLAHRLVGYRTFKCNGVSRRTPIYALNHFNADLRSYIRSWLQANADRWDYVFMDETSGTVLSQFYGPGAGMCPGNYNNYCVSTEEYPTDASVIQAHNLFFSSLTHSDGSPMKLFFNGANFKNNEMTDLGIVSGNSNMYGVMCEDCVVALGAYRPWIYPSVLNGMAEVNALPNRSYIHLSIGEDPPGSAAQIGERTATAAMAWLGYSPGHTVVFPNLEANTTNLPIWPEYNVVPMQPLESMTSGAVDLEVGRQIYRREFATCYNAGVPIGPCAAIVNGTSSTITVSSSWLKQHYAHVIQLSGGDIPSGGTVLLTSQTFVPATTTLAPGHAILLAR